MEMETDVEDNTDKRKGDAQEQGESRSKRLKCSIEAAAFCCDVCTKPLGPPIFQCTVGHVFCSSCHDKLPEEKCTFNSGCTGTLARSLGMENAVQSIVVDGVDPCHAERDGHPDIPYFRSYKHERFIRRQPCCPEPGCCFAGRVAELQDHLTGNHQWLLMSFQYWEPFDLRVVEPGSYVLHCRNDGVLFLLSVQPAVEPNGLAVSLARGQYTKTICIGCSVSFSLNTSHRSTSTLDDLELWWKIGWPPTQHICVLPKVSDGPDDAGVVLTINITSYDAATNDDSDDSSYDDSDEDDDDGSSS